MRILGIDPSTASCGWAIFDGEKILASGSDRFPAAAKPTKGGKGLDLARAGAVADWMKGNIAFLAARHDVTHIVVEEPLPSDAFAHRRNTNRTTQQIMATLATAVGEVANRIGVPCRTVNQSTWRAAFGIMKGAPRKGKRSDYAKARAIDVCGFLDGNQPETHDEAEARLIARWLADQMKHERIVRGAR